jgi:hypothetical protein
MPAVTKRALILAAFSARLMAIEAGDDFSTDAGQKLFIGEGVELGEDDPDAALAIVPSADDPTWQMKALGIKWPIRVQALVKANLDDPTSATEAVIGDIKRAIELEDRTFGGLLSQPLERVSTRSVERQPGSDTVGAEVVYIATYKEMWGAP